MKVIDKIEKLDDTIDDFYCLIEDEKDIELKDVFRFEFFSYIN